MPFHTIAGLGSMTTLTLLGATLVLPAERRPGGDPADPRPRGRHRPRPDAHVLPRAGRRSRVRPADGRRGAPLHDLRRPGGARGDRGLVGAPRRTCGGAPTGGSPSCRSWARSAGSARSTDIPGDGDPSWIGKPVSHLEVRVVDEDGDDAELGELICRSPSVMLGYHSDPERTAGRPRLAAGCTPATSCASTPRATCSSSTGATT